MLARPIADNPLGRVIQEMREEIDDLIDAELARLSRGESAAATAGREAADDGRIRAPVATSGGTPPTSIGSPSHESRPQAEWAQLRPSSGRPDDAAGGGLAEEAEHRLDALALRLERSLRRARDRPATASGAETESSPPGLSGAREASTGSGEQEHGSSARR